MATGCHCCSAREDRLHSNQDRESRPGSSAHVVTAKENKNQAVQGLLHLQEADTAVCQHTKHGPQTVTRPETLISKACTFYHIFTIRLE